MLDILVVCTGNICRSPMAAALIAQRLRAAGVPVNVTSAGLATADQPADPLAASAVARHGGDVGEHRSRRLDAAEVAGADLILGMERLHVREAVVLERDAWSRAFTLKELVRRGEAAGARGADEPVGAWLARLHLGRQIPDLLGADEEDDIADPRGGSPDEYELTAAELDDLITRLVRVMAPPP
jgi:protein-tyrosine phosphatase